MACGASTVCRKDEYPRVLEFYRAETTVRLQPEMASHKVALSALLGLVLVVLLLLRVYRPFEDVYYRTPVLSGNVPSGSSIAFVYTGRWKFLRIQLPYIFRELRKNGGVLDEVWFMMLNYDEETHHKLLRFVEVANTALKTNVFYLHFMGFPPGKLPPHKMAYRLPYREVLSDMANHPHYSYFKLDDDIVYIHPRAFTVMLREKNVSQCSIHLFNIAGSNWRCSWLHQKNHVYDDTNPENLKFGYSPSADCGWGKPECAELTLNTFLHHQRNNQLDKFLFEGLELISNRKRFSINALLFDMDLINIPIMMEVGPISKDDEEWWTVTYASKLINPTCIVGEALVVHFAYRTVATKMLELHLLEQFEMIVMNAKNSFKMHNEVWKTLGYDLI